MKEVLTLGNGREVCIIGNGRELCVVGKGREVCSLGLPGPLATVDALSIYTVDQLTMTVNQLDGLP